MNEIALPELITFAIVGAICLVAACGVILSRNPVYSALLFAVTLFGIAVFFVMQAAPFIAAVQIIVYAGAVVVLFLFVITFLGVDKEEDLTEGLRGQRTWALLLGGALVAEAVILFGLPLDLPAGGGGVPGAGTGNVEAIGESVFTTYLYPFELTSVLLAVAAIAAVVLAKKEEVR